MLKQTEGSRAVAEAIALCRPQVICAYPITPQTHIVEALGEMVKTRRARRLRVHQRRVRIRGAVGGDRRLRRRRAQLHGDASQGLLFMAEAVYNAAGLGLPIVMTIGNRAIGAPINIWNDHSDSMSMRDAGWIQLFAETNQEALDLHIQAFRLAEELSCPVMVCMDGFILTHAYERVDVPTQAAGRRVPAAVRAAADARSGRPGVDRRDGRAGSVHRSALSRASQAAARAGADPAAGGGVPGKQFGRDSGGLLRTYRTEDAETIVVALGSVNGTVQEVVDEMRDDGVEDRLGVDLLVPAVPAGGAARCAAGREARRRARKMPRGRPGRHRLRRRAQGAVGHRSSTATRSSPASAGARSRAARCGSCSRTPSADELEQVTFLDLNADVVSARARAREQARRRTGPTAEAILRRLGTVASRIG